MKKISDKRNIDVGEPTVGEIEEALAGQLKLARQADTSYRRDQERAIADFYIGHTQRTDRLLDRGEQIFDAAFCEANKRRDLRMREFERSLREDATAFAATDWQKLASQSPQEAAEAMEVHQRTQNMLNARDDRFYGKFERERRQAAAATQAEWDQLANLVNINEDIYQTKVSGLREALQQCDHMAQRQMIFWEKVIDKAMAARQMLDDLAGRWQERAVTTADASMQRELAEKEQSLKEYLARTKLRIEENQAINQDLRERERVKNDHEIRARQQADRAALEEIEAYAKHNLTGQGRHYKFTYERR